MSKLSGHGDRTQRQEINVIIKLAPMIRVMKNPTKRSNYLISMYPSIKGVNKGKLTEAPIIPTQKSNSTRTSIHKIQIQEDR